MGMFEKATVDRPAKTKLFRSLRLFEAAALLCGILLFSYALVVGFGRPDDAPAEPEVELVPALQDKDYSRFVHNNQLHSRLPCLLCHRRDTNSPRIGFPGKQDHLPCAGCHALQFADKASPICTICHTNAETGAMKRFPGLKSFGFKYDHARHTKINCATCHKPSGRAGAARSIPSGANAHANCFQCHSSRSSPRMVSCSTCHQQGRTGRTSEWSVAFRKGFSHAKHVNAKNVNCATCHTLRRGAPRGRQMSSPLTSMHFAPVKSMSCGGCHDGKKAFGPDDFSNCRRCHQGKTFRL